jgi:hypothetical protein
MPKVKIEHAELEVLTKYLNSCLTNDAKSIDLVKEYILARLVQDVYYKCQQLLLKYQQSRTYTNTRTLSINDLEILALQHYMSRYVVPDYLRPIEFGVNELIRSNSQLVNVLTNNIVWNDFLLK